MPSPTTAPTTDPILKAEQAHLALARSHLTRMREQTLALEVQAGNRVSAEYLALTLWKRVNSLQDDPDRALFFGRTDHDDGNRWYIGRRHVADDHGDPVVIDWRAEVSRCFYRAGPTNRLGVVRRRRFGLEGGSITAYEDEHLAEATGPAGHSAILAREIERPRVGPMRDIVATIQPEQDEIVRLDDATSVCVQGAPGTGKTAVGLHRAAWLLYAHRERLSRAGVLVVGPHASFLDHVAAVLPSLGEADVTHTTVQALVQGSAPGRTRPATTGSTRAGATGARSRRTSASEPDEEPVAVTVLKGDARLAEVLHRAVWSQLRPVTGPLVHTRGAHRWRVAAHRLTDIVTELRERGVRYDAARAMLPQRLAHAVLVQMEAAGDSPDDRVQDAVARSRDVRRCVDDLWPAVDPARLLWRLWSDPEFLAACAAEVLDEREQALLLWPRAPRSPGAARWSPADWTLLDEIGDVLRRTPSLGHVVLDEAQDLSPMQLRAVGRRCATGSATVLGDLAQGTTPWATDTWDAALGHLGKPEAELTVLDRGFRVPAEVLAWAAQLLPEIAPGLGVPTSVREDPGSLTLLTVGPEGADAGPEGRPGLRATDGSERPSVAGFPRHAEAHPRLWPVAVNAVREALAHEGSVGLIVPDRWAPAARQACTAAGWELVVLGDPAPDAHPTSPAPSGLPTTSEGAAETATDPEPVRAAPPRLSIVPAGLSKGLEFDHVVVAEPAEIVAAEPDRRTGLRRLYVVLTRAVSRLGVVHARPLPEALVRMPAGTARHEI